MDLLSKYFNQYILEEDDYKNIIDILITQIFSIYVLKLNKSDQDAIKDIKNILSPYLEYLDKTINKEV